MIEPKEGFQEEKKSEKKKRPKKVVQAEIVIINNCKGAYKLRGKIYHRGEEIPQEEIEKLSDEQLASELKNKNLKEIKK
jgi:hypothetical protein